MAFLRDGTNRQLDGEFIQAFYAYNFIIEGLSRLSGQRPRGRRADVNGTNSDSAAGSA